jgi:protein required for attachment to host cells
MAKALPSAQDLGVVGVQPSLAVASYKGATGGEDDAARGMYAAGGQFGAASEHLYKAQEQFDTLQAEDRFNQYQERLNQIANDPQTGWKTAQGENTLKPEFNRKYAEQFEDERKKLADSLDSPGAKQRFSQLAASAALRHRAALYEHSAKERSAYEGKVFDDSIKTIKANAWRAFGDDALFQAELARAKALTENFAKSWAVGASEESVKLAVQQVESNLWTHRIQAAVAAGDTKLARELMGKATASLTTSDKEAIDAKVKPQIKIAEAQEKVDGIFARIVPANPNAPFPALELDAALRKEFAGDPEGLRLARQEADYRASKIQQQQRESNHANLASVMQNLHEKKMSPADVMKTPEYQALDGDQKARFIQHIDALNTSAASRAASLSARAAAEEARAMARREREGEIATLMYLANPETLGAMNPNNAKELLMAHARLQKPGAVKQARMTQETFKSIIRDYDYDANLLTGKPKTSKDKETQAELSTMFREVNQLIQTRENELKRPLTGEEQEKLMRDAVKQKVKISSGFFGLGSKEVSRLAISTAEPEKAQEVFRSARIPIEQVDPELMTRSIEFVRANRKGFEKRSDAEIRALLKEPLERAAAVFELNGPPELYQNILRGNVK